MRAFLERVAMRLGKIAGTLLLLGGATFVALALLRPG